MTERAPRRSRHLAAAAWHARGAHLLLRLEFRVLLALVTAPAFVSAQEFEGVVTMRELYVESVVLAAGLADHSDSLSLASLTSIEDWARAEGTTLETTEMRYYVSGSSLRSAPVGPSGAVGEYMIIDFAAGHYRIVDPRQNLIVEWHGRTSEDSLPRSDEATGSSSIAPIAGSRDINGYPCRARATAP